MLNKSRIDHLWLDYHIRGKSLQHIDLVKIVDRFHNMSAERFFIKMAIFQKSQKQILDYAMMKLLIGARVQIIPSLIF